MFLNAKFYHVFILINLTTLIIYHMVDLAEQAKNRFFGSVMVTFIKMLIGGVMLWQCLPKYRLVEQCYGNIT